MCSKEKCCGCSACMAVCPLSLIKMIEDEEGFLYPKIVDKEKCISCGLCEKVCPITNGEYESDKEYYAAVNFDNDVWEKSSSGGIFYELAKYVIEELNGFVFGAKWDGFDVKISCANSETDLRTFRKSKYVASDPGQSFKMVKEKLDNDKYVLFSGTPCMINGLKNYLSKEYEKLYTIDFACHGHGSPVVFKKWVEYIEIKYKNTLIHYSFREKKVQKDHINSNCVCYVFEKPLSVWNGGKNTLIVTRDYYHHAYVKGLCMRKSCEECVFPMNRASEITLADFKRQNQVLPFSIEKRNISTIIVNNAKGKKLLNKISKSLKYYEASREYIEKYNPKIVRNIPANKDRDMFMEKILSNYPIKKIILEYARIIPSEWLEYNCSKAIYHIWYPFFHLFDYFYFIIRKVKRTLKRQ